jgi:chromosome segregation ATPase
MVNVLMTGQEIRDRDGRELELESELAALRAQVKKDTGRIDALVALNEQKNRELAVSQAECGRLREAAAQLLQVQSLLDVTRSALESNLRAQLTAAQGTINDLSEHIVVLDYEIEWLRKALARIDSLCGRQHAPNILAKIREVARGACAVSAEGVKQGSPCNDCGPQGGTRR